MFLSAVKRSREKGLDLAVRLPRRFQRQGARSVGGPSALGRGPVGKRRSDIDSATGRLSLQWTKRVDTGGRCPEAP